MEPYGGLIKTPNIVRIAERGLTYTSFHTTALCSPTRSCLLRGRNHRPIALAVPRGQAQAPPHRRSGDTFDDLATEARAAFARH
jgi:arylsulfatase A-like enzyme